ncbi:MAG: PspC domain-containing protein [Patescibacteria group bacterium]
MAKTSPKKLTLGKEKMIAGVCSGVAEYMNQDVSLIRLAVMIITISTGFVPMFALYFIAAWIIPEK